MAVRKTAIQKRIDSVTGAGRNAGKTRSYYGRMSVRINPKTGNQIASGSAQGFSMSKGGKLSRGGQMLSRRARYGQVRAAMGMSSG